MEYQRVVLHGMFDHRTEFYVRPRQLLSEESRQRIRTSEKGAQVITPFHCKETKSVIYFTALNRWKRWQSGCICGM